MGHEPLWRETLTSEMICWRPMGNRYQETKRRNVRETQGHLVTGYTFMHRHRRPKTPSDFTPWSLRGGGSEGVEPVRPYDPLVQVRNFNWIPVGWCASVMSSCIVAQKGDGAANRNGGDISHMLWLDPGEDWILQNPGDKVITAPVGILPDSPYSIHDAVYAAERQKGLWLANGRREFLNPMVRKY